MERAKGGPFIVSPGHHISFLLCPASFATLGPIKERRFGVWFFALDELFEAGHEGALAVMGLLNLFDEFFPRQIDSRLLVTTPGLFEV